MLSLLSLIIILLSQPRNNFARIYCPASRNLSSIQALKAVEPQDAPEARGCVYLALAPRKVFESLEAVASKTKTKVAATFTMIRSAEKWQSSKVCNSRKQIVSKYVVDRSMKMKAKAEKILF